MRGKIWINDQIYDRIIWSYKNKGHNTYIVIFDENNQNLIITKVYDKKGENAFIYNSDVENWAIVTPNKGSYLDDEKFFSKIKNKTISKNIIQKLQAIQNKANIEQTTYSLNNEQDIANIMNLNFNFHDAVLMHITNKDNEQLLWFDSPFSGITILRCEKVLENNLIIGDSYFEGKIYCHNEQMILRLDPIVSKDYLVKLVCTKMSWFFIPTKTFSINDYQKIANGISFHQNKKTYQLYFEPHIINNQEVVGFHKQNLFPYHNYYFFSKQAIVIIEIKNHLFMSKKKYSQKIKGLKKIIKEDGLELIMFKDN